MKTDTQQQDGGAVASKDGLGRKRWGKDVDISALKNCIRALDKSSSPKMLRANLGFLFDRYIVNPSQEIPTHLRPTQKPASAGLAMPL